MAIEQARSEPARAPLADSRLDNNVELSAAPRSFFASSKSTRCNRRSKKAAFSTQLDADALAPVSGWPACNTTVGLLPASSQVQFELVRWRLQQHTALQPCLCTLRPRARPTWGTGWPPRPIRWQTLFIHWIWQITGACAGVAPGCKTNNACVC